MIKRNDGHAGLACGYGRDRLAARWRSRHPLAGAARSDGRLARRRCCRASACRRTRAGVPASWRSRMPTGCGRVVPASRRPTPAASRGNPGRRRCTPCRRCRSSDWTAVERRCPSSDPARRRARSLGARRAALLRRRGRAVHQRPHDRDRRLLRGGRGRDRGADPRRAARGRRLELRSRERVGALLVRHDDRRARRAARVRARDRRFRRGAGSPAQRGGVSARAQPVPSQEHGRGRRPGVSRLRIPLLLATTTCCAPSTTSAAPARTRNRGWRRPSRSCSPSGSPTAGGCSTASIRVVSTSTSKTASVHPVGGTRCAPCACSTGGTEGTRSYMTRRLKLTRVQVLAFRRRSAGLDAAAPTGCELAEGCGVGGVAGQHAEGRGPVDACPRRGGRARQLGGPVARAGVGSAVQRIRRRRSRPGGVHRRPAAGRSW